MIIRRIIIFLILATPLVATAKKVPHYSCAFNKTIFVDSSGVYESDKWRSEGFIIKEGWIHLDSGDLKLKLNTNIQSLDILRGHEIKKGYQFSLENDNFIYMQLMVPLARSMTVTGSCRKDNE